jgi:hypothetical protein
VAQAANPITASTDRVIKQKKKPSSKTVSAAAAVGNSLSCTNSPANDTAKFKPATDSDTDDTTSVCGVCNEPVADDERVITCDICLRQFHDVCTGLSSDTFDVLVTIHGQTGWVCMPCRSESNSLRCALTRTNEELADIRVSLKWLSDELMKLKSISHSPSFDAGTHGLSSVSGKTAVDTNTNSVESTNKSKIHLEVHLAMKDLTRRKSNVIVTGLPEPTATTDAENQLADKDTFVHFCEENLTVKPVIAYKGCIRLGKHDGVHPRRLLVHLTNEEAATQVLQAAKSLHRNKRNSTSHPVYINPDLSPTEAKLAFEQRQRRRMSRAAETITQNITDHYVSKLEPVHHPADFVSCAQAPPVINPEAGQTDPPPDAGLNIDATPFRSSITPSTSTLVATSPFH